MQLTTFQDGGRVRAGAVIDDEIVDLGTVLGGENATVNDILEAGPDAMERASAAIAGRAERFELAGADIRPPVLPRKFFAVGLNYADHVAESGIDMPSNLTVFYKAPTCTAGPFDAIELPAVSSMLDYEGELGIVIGRRCRHVKADDAGDVIAGYVVVNDVSVRDWQLMTQQWSIGKSFDTHGPIGPYLTTADELGDPHGLDLRTSVNGEPRQRSNTSNLIFSCFDIVEVLSQACTLEPGDVIATGTPSGVAAGMPGRPWLRAGDRVRVEIAGIGAIDNPVVAETVPVDFAPRPEWVGGRGGVSA